MGSHTEPARASPTAVRRKQLQLPVTARAHLLPLKQRSVFAHMYQRACIWIARCLRVRPRSTAGLSFRAALPHRVGGLAPVALPFISRTAARCTRRSIAATVMAGSGNTDPHSENGVFAVMARLCRS